jgi:DNA-binding NarL/FixJ family response regulator
VRIIVADDAEVMRRGLRVLLEEEPEWRVCAEAADGSQAVTLAAELRPEVAILDASMPVLNGVEATRGVRERSPSTEILLWSIVSSETLFREALSSGARGYVLKSDPAAQIVAAVAAVANHVTFVSPRVSRTLDCPRKGGRLTRRELEVAQLLAEGKSNWCIGTILGIRTNTVETHRRNIMQKLELESIVELVHYAVRNQLIVP